MFKISVPIAFTAGTLSFFAPCVLPLLPAYIGFIAGITSKEIEAKGFGSYRFKIFVSTVFYILGFSLIFVILGTTVGGIGMLFRRNLSLLHKLGGLVLVFFGLELSGFLDIPFLSMERKINLPIWIKRLGYLRPFLVGIIFGLAWTPCVGAVLGSILALAAVSGTAVQGAYLLFANSLGISLPFLILALTLAQTPQYLKTLSKFSATITKLAGVLLLILGLLLIFDLYKYLNVIF